MAAHRSTQIEHKLEQAEVALSHAEPDTSANDLLGQVAAIRAMEAAIDYDTDTIIAQAQQALAQLHPDNLYIRTAVTRALAIAYQFRGERAAARDTYQQAIAMSEASDNTFINILSTTGLGLVEESENQLSQAAASFERVLHLVGDPNQAITCSARLGLARIHYEWNDLEQAQADGMLGVRLAQQIESIDTAAVGEIFLAHLKIAQGDLAGAVTALDAVEKMIHQHNFARQIPTVAAVRVRLCLLLGDLQGAAQIAHAHDMPLSQARVYLTDGQLADALAVLMPYRQQMEAQAWQDERLKTLVLQALAHDL